MDRDDLGVIGRVIAAAVALVLTILDAIDYFDNKDKESDEISNSDNPKLVNGKNS